MSLALTDMVTYEREYPLELTHPESGAKLGVTFSIKHIDCQAATEVSEKNNILRAIMNKGSGEENKKSSSVDVYAACISGWDWGGMEFIAGEGELEYSPENALKVMKHPSCKWVIRQVMNACMDIGNFTQS